MFRFAFLSLFLLFTTVQAGAAEVPRQDLREKLNKGASLKEVKEVIDRWENVGDKSGYNALQIVLKKGGKREDLSCVVDYLFKKGFKVGSYKANLDSPVKLATQMGRVDVIYSMVVAAETRKKRECLIEEIEKEKASEFTRLFKWFLLHTPLRGEMGTEFKKFSSLDLPILSPHGYYIKASTGAFRSTVSPWFGFEKKNMKRYGPDDWSRYNYVTQRMSIGNKPLRRSEVFAWASATGYKSEKYPIKGYSPIRVLGRNKQRPCLILLDRGHGIDRVHTIQSGDISNDDEQNYTPQNDYYNRTIRKSLAQKEWIRFENRRLSRSRKSYKEIAVYGLQPKTIDHITTGQGHKRQNKLNSYREIEVPEGFLFARLEESVKQGEEKKIHVYYFPNRIDYNQAKAWDLIGWFKMHFDDATARHVLVPPCFRLQDAKSDTQDDSKSTCFSFSNKETLNDNEAKAMKKLAEKWIALAHYLETARDGLISQVNKLKSSGLKMNVFTKKAQQALGQELLPSDILPPLLRMMAERLLRKAAIVEFGGVKYKLRLAKYWLQRSQNVQKRLEELLSEITQTPLYKKEPGKGRGLEKAIDVLNHRFSKVGLERLQEMKQNAVPWIRMACKQVQLSRSKEEMDLLRTRIKTLKTSYGNLGNLPECCY